MRDEVRAWACAGSVDHTAIAKLADSIRFGIATPQIESSEPYHQVFNQFCEDIRALATQQAPARDLLALCDQLRDVHLWKLGIYLEDRNNAQPALIRPLDKLLIETREEKDSARATRARAKLEQEVKDAERERETRERARINPRLMFRILHEYQEWDDNGIPTVDVTGKEVSKSRRKKLGKEWEKQKKRHDEWLLAGETT